jgi:hypothetical protein
MPSSISLGRDRLVFSPESKIGPDPRWIALSNFLFFFYTTSRQADGSQTALFYLFIHESFSPAYFLLNQMITENTDVLVTV